MVRRPSLSALAASFLAASFLFSQAPTGTISGSAIDESGAVVPGAKITVTNRATGIARTLTSGQEGTYSVPSLPAGEYEVRCEASGFRVLIRPATVETGNGTRVDLPMQVGATRDVVTVEEATSQISYESHRIDGVVTRKQIEELPLNGRSFLQLAFLEPGVGVGANSLAQYNAQFSVSILGGASNMTAITVDGGNVRNSIEGNTGMNFSQDMVQEFQVSAANFDLSTPITGVGAVNIVTRGGGNDFHGSGYFFFRDHNLSAYPALVRNPFNPDPFFARRQSGAWFGGPLKKDRLFFFFNIEHNNQDSVVTVQPNSPYFSALAGNYSQPYTGKQISQRFDWRVTDRHNVFLRYSHDGNNGFGPSSGANLPSNWLKNTNWSDQSIFGLTSTFTSNLVNDLRFSYQYWQNRNLFPGESDCPGCIGLGLPQMQVAGTNVQFGNTSNATQGRDLRKFNLTDNFTWQRGEHRWRFGGEYENAPGTGFWGYADPAAGVVFGPEVLGALAPAFGFPSSFRTNADLFKLPVAGFVMGIGDPSQPPPYNVDTAKVNRRSRLFWQDTWRMTSRFTLNFGMAWQYESTLVNHDLDKPAILGPVLGRDQLGASNRDFNNITPSLGFAWNLGNDNKTVIRGGGGIYYDTRLLWQRLEERAYLGPLGNGRIQVSGSSVPSPISIPSPVPGVLAPVTAGTTALNFPAAPTGFTLGHLMQILPGIRAAAERSTANPNPNDLSVRGIERAKTGTNLIPQHYPAAYSIHYNLGLQRELRRSMVLTADFVIRRFVNQEIGSLDYNRYNRVGGPVLPICTGAQVNDPRAICGTGAFTVRTPAGRTNYQALLVKLDKRFSDRYQFTASYALAAQHGLNGVLNLDNWFDSWGPQGSRHTLNISGIVDLPWKFQVSYIVSMASRGPFNPMVPVIDLNGDGTSGEPLPGARINGFNRGLGKEDLSRLVAEFNQNYAGKRTSRNQLIPTLTLPANYEFGDRSSSQDVRLTKNFEWADRYKVSVFAEVFNLLNIANLGGYSNQLTNPAAFGQPTNRAGQVFGSGGPRAIQLGARFSF